MAIYFFDSSAVVKYFHTELGSGWVRTIVDAEITGSGGRENDILIASLSIAEVPAAFAILERTKSIDKKLRDTMYDLFLNAIESEFQIVSPTTKGFYDAAELTQKHPLKGYDAVQLALALISRRQLQVQGQELSLVTSDAQLVRAARAEQMPIEDPESHPNP